MYPNDKKYSKDHEWVKFDEEVATIGITDYAQKELGEIVYVELPEVGASFNKNDVIGSVESVKAVSDVFAPISGEVVSVNELLEGEPELINNDPHGEGWMVTMNPSQPSEMDELMSHTDYEKYLKESASD
jgi:glycine cleavage system H protein